MVETTGPDGTRRAPPAPGEARVASFSLGWCGWIVLLVAVTGTWSTAALVLDRHARAQSDQQVQRSLERARVAVARRLQAWNDELYRAAATLAESRTMREAVSSRDRERVSEVLHGYGEHGWDLLVATDYLGRVLGAGGAAPPEREILSSPAVEVAVGGETTDTFWVRGNELFQVHLEPIQGDNGTLGMLAVGRRLDRSFLTAVRGGIESHLRLQHGSRPIAATAGVESTVTPGRLELGLARDGDAVVLHLLPVASTGVRVPWGILTASAALWLVGSAALGAVLLRGHREYLLMLARAAERMAEGEMEHPVEAGGTRESDPLANALEELRIQQRRRIEDAEGRCRELSGALELERRIGEHTEHRLGQAEASLREEAGRGVRELAHELKTPAATVNATTAGIRHGLEEWLGCVQALDLPRLEPETSRLFFAALEEIDRRAPLGPPAGTDRAALTEELARHHLADPDRAARVLIRTGLAPRWRELLALLRGGDSAAFLSALEAFGRVQVHLSCGLKAAEVLFRLGRSFGVRDEDSHEIDLRHGLDDALSLLDHELRGRVEVRRQVPVLPSILGNGDHLCQVWTNLIHNAVQAMGDEGGCLQLDAREESGWVIVAVTDSGPGVDPSVRGRIFEAHVTTKSPGEGTGIGLSVVRRIVEGHGGRISVDSIPGRTRFEVSLPVSRQAAAAVGS